MLFLCLGKGLENSNDALTNKHLFLRLREEMDGDVAHNGLIGDHRAGPVKQVEKVRQVTGAKRGNLSNMSVSFMKDNCRRSRSCGSGENSHLLAGSVVSVALSTVPVGHSTKDSVYAVESWHVGKGTISLDGCSHRFDALPARALSSHC